MKKIILFMAASAMLFACDKEQDSILDVNSAEIDNIVVFESYEEYNQELVSSLKRTPEERKVWEEEHGIVSFATKCSDLYNEIADMEFNSQNEIFTLVANNSKHLKLVQEESGDYSLECINESDPNRYLMNATGLFQIAQNVYKPTENGIAYTSIVNTQSLNELSFEMLESFSKEGDIKYLAYEDKLSGLKSVNGNCGIGEKQKTITNGKNRTVMQLNLRLDGFMDQVIPSCYYIVRPQKRTWGAWLPCKRTLSCDISVSINCQDRDGVWTTVNRTEKRTNEYKKYLSDELTTAGDFEEYCKSYYFISFNATGSSPNASSTLSCSSK